MNIKAYLKALDPTTITKLWTVTLSTWNGGRFDSFLTKKGAIKFAKDNWDYPFIDLKNEITKEEKRLKEDLKNERKNKI